MVSETTFIATSRRFRPSRFSEVIGQQACVTTLQNAIRLQRLTHAYLFAGPKGTGKTTLARLFAKAINCENPIGGFEPCNECPACKEIMAGTSLDVIEIDGASNRGIDDIRQITESVGYAPTNKYKVYIIDEVHMLTKEAFNALLKTLEEPPPRAKFLFATTEVHKLPQTILSRCQRFSLKRLTQDEIVQKLSMIAQKLGYQIETDALKRIAEYAEGGLRDAESMFDQLTAFSSDTISNEIVEEVLGLVPYSLFYAIDSAYIHHDVVAVLKIAEQIYEGGKDLNYFLEDLSHHFRRILLYKSGSFESVRNLDQEAKEYLEKIAPHITVDTAITILRLIVDAILSFKSVALPRAALEALLLEIIHMRLRIPASAITRAILDLKNSFGTGCQAPTLIEQPPVESISQPPQHKSKESSKLEVKKAPLPQTSTPPNTQVSQQARYDSLLQFASVEFETPLQKPQKT